MKNIFDFSPSPITLKRLAQYLCLLIQLPAKKFQQISSSQLAKMMGTKPSQLRQDFHHFGGFGQPGHPYDLPFLSQELKKIFGVTQPVNLLICGANTMGSVLLENQTLSDLNIHIKGVIDFDPQKHNIECCGLKVMSPDQLWEFVKYNRIHVGTICTPDPEPALNLLTTHGIKYIWNLSPKHITAPKGVYIYHENLAAGLLTLVYKLNN